MFDREAFEGTKLADAARQSGDAQLRRLALQILADSDRYNYSYQWTWLGLPIIQMPEDIIATQEIIWETKPDVIIEAGIAWGGSVVFHASLLQLIGKGMVVAIDLNLMDHVRDRVLGYPFADRIRLYKGSSSDPAIVAAVKSHIKPDQSVMLVLDSNHTHDHVLAELRAYAPLVTKGQFAVVCDTIIEDVPAPGHRPRPWGPGNNPKTAARAFLAENPSFAADDRVRAKQLLSHSPEGYLRRVA